MVVVGHRGVAPLRVVAHEVDRPTEDEQVCVGRAGGRGAHDHCGGEAVGRVGPSAWEQGEGEETGAVRGPLRVAGVVGLGVEGAAVEQAEGPGVVDGDGDLVAVLQVLADAREGLDEWDGVLGELAGRADAAEFEQLRGVESAAAEDDFVASADGAWNAALGEVGVAAEGAGFVEVWAFKVGDAGCFRLGAGLLVEEDAGDECVGFQGEGMACGDGVEDSLSDLFSYRCVSCCKESNNNSKRRHDLVLTLLLAPFFIINGIWKNPSVESLLGLL